MPDTTIDIKDHYNKVIEDLKTLFHEKFKSSEKLAEIVIGYNEKHFELLNNKDKQMREERVYFITRTEHDKLDKDIRDIQKILNLQEGKASQGSVYYVAILAIISLLLSGLDIVLRITGR